MPSVNQNHCDQPHATTLRLQWLMGVTVRDHEGSSYSHAKGAAKAMTDEEAPNDEQTPEQNQPSTIAARLEHLFKVVHPADRGPYSNAEVAERINADAGEQVLSATYLWQLKTGKRTDPTRSRLTAIAKFFGVSPMYFYEDEAAERTNEQLKVLSALRDEGVRQLVLRADGLSPRGLAGIAQMIEAARTVEGLPDGGDGEQPDE